MRSKQKFILWFRAISKNDLALVGGKNASLGEMAGRLSEKGVYPVKSVKGGAAKPQFNRVKIPDGFAITTNAYWYFLKENGINKKLKEVFAGFNPKSIKSLQATGKAARQLILNAEFPHDLEEEIVAAYKKLSQEYGMSQGTDVAVRSSGVAEDQPKASFAGQFETFLNVSGEETLLKAIKKCLASTFSARVIAYREEKGFSHLKFAVSVGVQKMVRSDSASSGVIFTIDTETGFPNVVLINSIWGVGEMVVKGKVTPDQFYVFKPTLRLAEPVLSESEVLAQGKSLKQDYKPIIVKNLGRKNRKYVFAKGGGLKEAPVAGSARLKFSLTDKEILQLARWAVIIEKHYKMPQDIEWAKDGKSGELFIVQSRPETVHTQKKNAFYQEYEIKTSKEPILTGIAIGDKIGTGRVRVIPDVSKISQFRKGEVLVTEMTDPDWVPAMRLASAIITDEGGKTAHAAIISRELGIACIVGTEAATKVLKSGQSVTVDCTQGLNGRIYLGKMPFRIKKYDLKKVPKLKTKIMINIGAPEIAFKTSFLPNDGVGLARVEFILAEKIRVHPLALYYYKTLNKTLNQPLSTLKKIIKQIDQLTVEHKDKREYFVKELAEGVAQIAAAFWPKEVIVRFSDLKTNEYRNLIGGELFEDEESNPMLGFRGASRYLDKEFQPAFRMECQAIKRVRNDFGLKNVSVMVPFCRTVEEGRAVLDLIEKFGLVRHGPKDEGGPKVYVMCEIPSNVILAEEFLDIFDGASLGTNDLLQTTLGIDRDNARLSKIADETNEAVKSQVVKIIDIANKKGKYSGICGDAPSTIPGFAQFLLDCKIGSISLSPDAVIKTILSLAKI